MSRSAVGVLMLLLVLSGLFIYKWGGSIRTLQVVHATSQLGRSPDPLVKAPPLDATWNYFRIVWPALVYGILIGAVLRSSISPRRVASLLGGDGVPSTVAGSVAGAPLMLCSCCIMPVFTGAWERGARLGPALAMMLASPGLNVAALALTFMLLPVPLSLARTAAALVIVLGLPTLIGRTLGDTVTLSRKDALASDDEEAPPARGLDYVLHLLWNVWYMTKVTVPLIVAGVFLSSLLLPVTLQLSALGKVLIVLVIALLAVPVALPTFFEIPLALFLCGYSPGAAAALLIAGPVINLPSLLVLAAETNARVALALATGVAAVAAVAGLAVSL